MNAFVDFDQILKNRIFKTDAGTYAIEMRTADGYVHWIDPFQTEEEAFEYYLRYYHRQDDLK